MWCVRRRLRKKLNLGKVNIERNGRLEAYPEDQKERMKFGETFKVDYVDRSFALCLRYGKG